MVLTGLKTEIKATKLELDNFELILDQAQERYTINKTFENYILMEEAYNNWYPCFSYYTGLILRLDRLSIG